MQGILTRTQIISRGLQLGGNPALATAPSGGGNSLAVDFYNLILDHIARSFDWPHLRKWTQVTSSVSDFSKIPGSSLPADYDRILKLRPKGVNAFAYMQQLSFEELLLRRQVDAEAAVAAVVWPTYFAIDEGAKSANGMPDIYVWQTPTTQLSYDILYFRIPAASTQDSSIPEFPNHYLLVNAIATWAKNYQRDQTMAETQRILEQVVAQYRNNMHDRGRSDAMQLELDPHSFPSDGKQGGLGWWWW